MNWWQYLLLVNLYLVLFYGFYALLLRKETFFHLNRIFLISSVILSFFIPVIHSDWIRNLFITKEVQHTISLYGSPLIIYHIKSVEEHHITIGQVLLLIYALGSTTLIIKFIWQLFSLRKVMAMSETLGAFSFFKSIRLGANLSNLEVITAHEQAHASQWHSVDVLFIEVISIINWFNPVIYFFRLEIKHIHEFIADRKALENGIDKAEYAILLLSQTFKTPHQLVNPFFNHSLLKQRIIMLQKNRSHYIALVKYGLSVPLFILMMILASVTVSKSKAIKLINKKAENLLSTPVISFSPVGGKVPRKPTAHYNDNHVQKPAIVDNVYKLEDINTPQATNKHHDDPAFITVEKEPEFRGGIAEFYRFLSKNIKFPEGMLTKNVQGKVFITLTVETDGSLSDIKTVKDIGFGAANEAIRVLKLSPKWEPGYQNGQRVRVRYTIPISFAIVKGEPADTTADAGIAKNKVDIPDKITFKNTRDTLKKTGTVLIGLDTQMNPVYIVDGRLVANLDDLDPDDIISIKLVKQTDEKEAFVPMYGAKALNGLVLIQTKALLKNR